MTITAYDPFDHRAILRARAPRLGRAGLSAAKIKTLRTMAKAIEQPGVAAPHS